MIVPTVADAATLTSTVPRSVTTVLTLLTAVTPETAMMVPTVAEAATETSTVPSSVMTVPRTADTVMLARTERPGTTLTVCEAPSHTTGPVTPESAVVDRPIRYTPRPLAADPGLVTEVDIPTRLTICVPRIVLTMLTRAPVIETTGIADMLTGPLTTTKTLVPVTETTPETATESATRTTRPKTLAASDAVEPCSAWFAPAVVPVIETATPTEAPETVPAVLTVNVVGEIVTVPLTTAETEAPCWIVTEAPVTVPAVLTVTVPDTRTVPRTVATVKLVATDTRIVPSTVAIVAAVARVTICVPRIVSTVMAVATLTRTVPRTVSTVLMSMTPPDTWTVPEI